MTLEELIQAGKALQVQIEEMIRTQQAPTGATAPSTQAPASGCEAILQRPIGTWTQADRDLVRGEVNSVLRDLRG